MNRSRQDHMRSPFQQDNISTSSLEGMERPVRSFKSFIRTVPPLPQSAQKPLPPTPVSKPSISTTTLSQPGSTPSPTSPVRSSSFGSWYAPTDWYDQAGAPSVATNRAYSPLIPEPSPDVFNMVTEPTSYLDGASQLVPIYERPSSCSDLGPPSSSPPLSPLPAPPIWTLNGVTKQIPLASINHHFESSKSQAGNKSLYESDLRYRTASPAGSTHTSVTSTASTKEKAFAALGINSPRQQTAILEERSYDPESIHPMERTRADRQYLRSKRLGALNKGSPLADDSWEDTEMDDKTRMLSFSQDYHSLLSDQYQEMNISEENMLQSGGPYEGYEAQSERSESKPRVPPRNYGDLYPQPLAWAKNSNASSPFGSPRSPRSMSQDGTNESSSSAGGKRSRHKRIASWVPHQLKIVSGRRRSSADQSERARNRSTPPPKQTGIPNEEDLRFSMFFPSTKSLKFRKKSVDHNIPLPNKALPLAASPPKSLMRLPGGFAVVRNSPPPPPPQTLDTTYMPETTPISPSSEYSTQSDPFSSFDYRHSRSPVTPETDVRTKYRFSNGSSYSKGSSISGTPSHPYPNAIAIPHNPRIPPPPPPPVVPSLLSSSPPFSPEAWNRLASQSGGDAQSPSQKPGFMEKSRKARQVHRKEVRQERLKKSIKVLGSMDPGAVSGGYVRGEVDKRERREAEEEERADSDVEGRLPGYLVGGLL